ncbi:MAG TPA: hypothetical protein VNZ52_15440, partial [Candidatus Thermoplasmatota archaeon]|nr:hypothetical protein [Candidatus Thermoplasmatota archaeon]
MDNTSGRKMDPAPKFDEESRPTEGVARPPQPRVGVAAVLDAVKGVQWPATSDDIRRVAGNPEISTSKVTHFPLERILGRLTRDRFVDRGAFERELLAQWDRIESLESPFGGNATRPA